MQATIGNWTISIKRDAYTRDDLTDKYNALSDSWDATIARMGFYRAYTELFYKMAHDGILSTLPHHAKVFDAGIGTGALSFALGTAHQQALHFHGMDISANMLAQAQANLNTIGAIPELEVGDACDLSYEDDTFDLSMTAHMLEHLANPFWGLRELVRVTKSGGKILVITTRKSLLGQYIDFQWRLNRFTPAQLQAQMRQLGLVDIQPYRLGGPVWSNWMSMVYVGTKV